MTGETLLMRVSATLNQSGISNGGLLHENSGTFLVRQDTPTAVFSTVYKPMLCLILQGTKEIGSNDKSLTAHAGQSLIVSHILPVVSRITEAGPEQPYVALVFPLDLELLRSLASEVLPSFSDQSSDPFSICLCDTDDALESTMQRYFDQCETQQTRQFIAPITKREIHVRLLLSPHAQVLRKLLWHESTASRVFQATKNIQSNLAEKIIVGELAQSAGMSSSAFFERFKAVTGTSPLQYQKDLRLLRARGELQSTNAKISDIAFGVGYESSAQFSREFSRKFGRTPRQDRSVENLE